MVPVRPIDKVRAAVLAGLLAGCGAPEAPIAAERATRVVAPGPHTYGRVAVTVTAEPGGLVASTVAGPVDPRALPKDITGTLPIETLAPFVVTVDTDAGRVVAGPVTLPGTAWPLVAGARVRVDGEEARIARVDGAGLMLAPGVR